MRNVPKKIEVFADPGNYGTIAVRIKGVNQEIYQDLIDFLDSKHNLEVRGTFTRKAVDTFQTSQEQW